MRQQRLTRALRARRRASIANIACGRGGSFAWVHDRGTAELDDAAGRARMLGVVRAHHQPQGAGAAARAAGELRRADRPFQQEAAARGGRPASSPPTQRRAAPGAYLAVGIDKLTMINDAFGYEAADTVLIEIGRRLDRCLRVSDVDRPRSAATVSASCWRIARRRHVAPRPRRSWRPSSAAPVETAARPGLRHGVDRQRLVSRPGHDLLRRDDPRRRPRSPKPSAPAATAIVPYRLSERAARSGIASAWRSASEVQRALQRGAPAVRLSSRSSRP